MYINTSNLDYPITFELLTKLHPDTSFPPGDFEPPTPFAIVYPSEKPMYDRVTQYIKETTPTLINDKWVQNWEVVEFFDTPEKKAAAMAASANAEALNIRAAAKKVRASAVEAIKVTTAAGNTFDGDEVSQGRMARAIIGLSTGLAPTVTWILADNTTIEASSAELTEALVLSGQAQSAIWQIP